MVHPHQLRRLYGLSAILFLTFLFWVATLIPPIQSPDEYQHLYRAYLLSTGQPLLKAAPDSQAMSIFQRSSQVGGDIDRGLLAYKDAHWPLVLDPQRQLSSEERHAVSKIHWQNTHQFVPMPGAGYYFPLIYAPQALGMFTGRLLGWPVHQGYWLSRIFTTLTCLILLGFAVRALQPPPLAWAVLFLPMSVFQLLSPTIDGLTISLAMLTLSLFVRASLQSHQPEWGVMVAMALSIFMLTSTRTHLLPLLALPFYLAWRHRHIQHAWWAAATALAALCWVAFAITTSHDDRVQLAVNTGATLWHYVLNPGEYVRMVWVSLSDPDVFIFYERSFVGILGWLNVSLPETAYVALWSGLGLCFLVALVSNVPSSDSAHTGRWFLIFLAFTSTGLVFLAMLITWTPMNASHVEGVQGRYFTIPAMMLAYASFGGRRPHARPSSLWVHVMVVAQAAASLWVLILALLARYD